MLSWLDESELISLYASWPDISLELGFISQYGDQLSYLGIRSCVLFRVLLRVQYTGKFELLDH